MPLIAATSRAWASTSPTSSAFCSPVEARRASQAFGPWRTREIAGLRPDQGAPGAGVAGAIVAQHRAIRIPRPASAGLLGHETVDLALQRDLGPGEGRVLVAAGGDQRGEALHRLAPRGGDGDGEFGDLALGGVEPDFFAAPLLQQAVAVAQRAVQRRSTRAPCSLSTASTSRSRKRRRSPAAPVNSPSMAGVSQTIAE